MFGYYCDTCDTNVQIKNTRVYRFKDGSYYVSFHTNNNKKPEVFYGTREQIIPQMSLRIKRILHVR